MPSDSGDSNRRSTKAISAGAPPPEQQQLPCPRCDSTNTKRNAKRSRTTVVSSSTNATSTTTSYNDFHLPAAASQVLLPLSGNQGASSLGMVMGGESKGNGFASLLNNPQGPGYLGLGGFGLGIGPALEDIGFGLRRGMWGFSMADGAAVSGGNGGAATGMGNQWQFEGGEAGPGCFSWPELAISTPGNLLN
ncbi:hypothetical protein V6N13_064794 [Hibiscus sabdariffa]|uniref:Uncharacterized protein n=1 Tax=Hibiscus sabdariffa TaxID=183260 RepID=A0ABR2EB62_9ROSI